MKHLNKLSYYYQACYLTNKPVSWLFCTQLRLLLVETQSYVKKMIKLIIYYLHCINRECGHFREISDRGLDVLTER